MNMPSGEPEAALISMISRVHGVGITHYYGDCAGKYYIHLSVEDTAAIHRLCQLAAAANAPLQIYEHSDFELRYTLIIGKDSRNILLLMAQSDSREP